MKNILLVFIIMFSTMNIVFSQDIIHFKNGKKFSVNIIHIKNNLIFYMDFNDDENKLNSVDVDKIHVIYFQNRDKSLYKTSFGSKPKEVIKKTILVKKIKKDSSKNIINIAKIIKSRWKNSIGIGIDVFMLEKDQSLAGISLDCYLGKNLNIAAGYGYLYGKPRPYFSGKIIYSRINRNWSPILGMSYSFIDHNQIKKTSVTNLNSEDLGLLLTPSLGFSYLDETGMSFDLKLGASLIKIDDEIHYNTLVLSLRVGFHK